MEHNQVRTICIHSTAYAGLVSFSFPTRVHTDKTRTQLRIKTLTHTQNKLKICKLPSQHAITKHSRASERIRLCCVRRSQTSELCSQRRRRTRIQAASIVVVLVALALLLMMARARKALTASANGFIIVSHHVACAPRGMHSKLSARSL